MTDIPRISKEQPDPIMGQVYAAFENENIPDFVARNIVRALTDIGIEFVDHHRDAPTTRGSRIPSTVPRLPIAAYNLGYQEGRASVTERVGEPDPDVVGWDDQKPREADMESQWSEPAQVVTTTRAEEPIEDRLHRAWLNGYREGSERAAHGPRWDHS